MWENRQQLAWTVLIASFLVFCFLLFAIPLSVHWYVLNASESRDASVEVIGGTVLLIEPGGRVPIAVSSGRLLREGSVLSTDSVSQAVITLFDKSTLVLLPRSRITLEQMRSPQYPTWSDHPHVLQLTVNAGRVRLSAAEKVERGMRLEVQTPHTTALVKAGSYSLEVSSTGTEIVVRDGRASVTAAGKSIILNARERASVAAGNPPLGPLPAARDLIVNGNFKQGLNVGWQSYSEGSEPGDVKGQVSIVTLGDRQAASFERRNSQGRHIDTGLRQEINKDVSDAVSLKLRLDARLIYHSLSGGGYLSSEYPVMVRLHYRDAAGNPGLWVVGFYYHNDTGNPTQNGLRIPRDIWFPYETDNLLETLNPKPAVISFIQVLASGHDFQSMVSEVGLIVE